MLMPETAMREDNFFSAWKDNVGPSGKVSAMQAESVPEPVNQAPQGELRVRILAADAPHIATAPFRAELVHAAIP